MKKFKLLFIPLLALVCLCSCKTEPSPELFSDHLVDVWSHSLEPFSYDFAFYGDSRVIGADWVSEFSDYSVVNLGIGGDIVSGLIRRLPLLKAADVKYCFVAIGGNDCLSSNFNTEVFEQQYRTLLTSLSEMKIDTYVCTIAGITGSGNNFDKATIKRGNTNIALANNIIENLCSSMSVPLIDMAKLMNNEDGSLNPNLSTDGIHFNSKGNKIWFDTVRPFVELCASPFC